MIDVLIVEDEAVMAKILSRHLTGRGYQVATVETVEQANECLTQNPQAAIIDIKLPGGDGELLIEHIKSLLPDCRILVWTALPDGSRLDHVREMGIDGIVRKSVLNGLDYLFEILPPPREIACPPSMLDVPYAPNDLVKAVEVYTAAVKATTEAIVEASHRIDGQAG